MKLSSLALSLAALAVTSTSHAVLLDQANSTLAGNTLVADFSDDGRIEFDLDLNNQNLMTFRYIIQSEDGAAFAPGGVTFNAILNNFLPDGLKFLRFDFKNVDATAGTVRAQFNGTQAGIFESLSNVFTVAFAAPEFIAAEVGNPLMQPGQVNWTLNNTNFQPGQTYEFTVQAVPEPSDFAMIGAGLLIVGAIARRRRSV
jgi:hypothetical protein